MIFSRTSKKTRELRIKLDELELRTLLRGGELTLESKATNTKVKMILADIGFDQIQKCLNDVIEGKDHYKPHTASMDL